MLPPPESLKRDVSRDDDLLMAVDVEHLDGMELDRLYAELEQRGELRLTRREQRHFSQMSKVLLLCMVSYACLLVAYVLGWVARGMGVLH